MNYTGSTQTATRSVSIATSNLVVSFTAVIDLESLNYVSLTNTSMGVYESFKWLYGNVEVENEMEHLAYFPFAGNYEIELVVTKNDENFSEKQSVIIEAVYSGMLESEAVELLDRLIKNRTLKEEDEFVAF